jgi:SAM-dependent methyltransferase
VDSYDDIPYDSTPIYETHPANLALQGRLFGLDPVAPEGARVLELGCASGGNLIPMAYHLPQAQFLGIELSAVQVAAGRALIGALQLENVRIEQLDVLRVDPAALGQFDYIIAHGFYSWVPAAVRTRLFEILAHCLSAHGIGYVSYNTLPGWRLRGMVRDMLLFHVRAAGAPRARLDAAYAALDKLEAVFATQSGAVAEYLRDELGRLRTRHPSYLYHEFLAEENAPCLFRDFVADATRHGLQYLCEAELHTMFPAALGEAALHLVEEFDDILEQEQVMDFLTNRMFRQTLLCRAERTLTHELDLDAFARYAFHGWLTPQAAPDLRRAAAQPFNTPAGAVCVATHPLAKAALLELGACYPDAVAYEALLAGAQARVRAAGGPAEESAALLPELVRLYLRHAIGVAPQPQQMAPPASTRPCASALARAQAGAGLGHVASLRHMPMGLDAFAARLLALLDGTRTRDELVAALVADVSTGRLRLATPALEAAELAATIEANVERLLATFARHGILAPPAQGGTHG